MQEVNVWDFFIRLFHWSMVAIIVVDFTIFDEGSVHEILGYVLLLLLMLRFIWGFVGPEHAKFKNFIPTRNGISQHIKEQSCDKRTIYLGHNPLGAVMIINLYLTLVLLGFSGYMAITDMFWGVEWVEELHEFFANYLLLSVFIHVAGVVFESHRSGVNLISAMFTGIKKVPK